MIKKGNNMKAKYTQEDAQLMADWFNTVNSLNTTANISKDVKDFFDKAEKIRIKIHQKVQKKGVFDFYRSKNNKVKIKYKG
jgi:hypothetical protein